MQDETCKCYKKLKYLEYCYNLENPQETERVEQTPNQRASVLNQREKAVKLPGVISINDSAFEYPDARNSDLLRLFPEMAQIITGLDDYEFNILSFWILDVFLEGLRMAQFADMSHRNQKATLHWMAYVYNVIQGSGSKLTRRDLFLKIKLFLLAPPDEDDDVESDEDFMQLQNPDKKWTVPFPPVWRADYNHFGGESQSDRLNFEVDEDDEEIDSERNLHDMEIIMEIIYHTYARLWSFFLLRTSLRSTPTLEILDLPFKLNVPKKVLKYDSTIQMKSAKGGRRTTSQRAIEEAAQGMEAFLRELFALPSYESIISERDKGKQDKKKK